MMAALEDEPPPLVADEQPASAEGQPTSADEQPRPAVKEQYVPADTQPANAAKHHSDTDSSSDGDESDAEQEPAPAAVEWLATGREKRSTAGNRLKHMLAAQEPDDELELLFAEDGDDAAFSEADEDGSDLHMDSSSDEEDAQGNGGGGDDDLEGEKELERKARENRQATRKRKAQEAIPLKFRKKKVKIAAENSPLVTSRLSAAANRPGAAAALAPRLKKKSERTSWLPTTGEMPTRASRRETTMMSKEQLHQQMIEREVKRIKQVEAMERKAKKMEALRKPPKTQAERLADAAVIEKRNAKSLNRWEEAEKQREEERRAKLAALNNRTLDGPVVTFWSGVGEWVDGKLKYVGKVVTIEEKPPKKKRGTEPDGEDTLRGTSEDVVMTEISAAEKAQAEESSLMVKSIAKGTGASQIASDEAAAPTKLPELPVTSTRDVGAQQETPAGAAQEAPMDMPYTATTSADESTSQQPQQLAPSEPEPQQAVVETDSRPSTTPNLPTSGSADTKPASLHAMEVSDSKRPEALATSESHEVEISPSAAPQSTGDMQASSTLIFDPPDQDTAMRGTEATKINTAVMTAPELEIKSSSSEAPHPQKPEDVDMQGAGDTVTTVAAIKIPPLVSDSTLQHPDLQTSSINTPGLAAYVEGTYTTMGFAPPSQLASTNPPDLGSHSPSFLARPVGISPGGLSIPQIGQFPTPGVPQSGLAPPQGDVDHQPPSLVSQVPLAPTPVIIAAKPVGQGGQPIVPNPTPGAEPNGFPTTSIHALAPLVAPKPVKPRGGRQKKEQEKEKEAETPPPPRTPPPDGKATRNCFIFQNFNENAIKEKSVQTRILFGKEMNKLAKPAAAPRCVITGQPARYKDPRTGLPYYNSFAYKEIQKLQKGEYKFSKLLGTWMGTGSGAATGVPARFLDPSAPAPPKAVPVALDQIRTPQRSAGDAGSGNVGVTTGHVVPSMQASAPIPVPFATMGASRFDQTQSSSVASVLQPAASPNPAVHMAIPPIQSSTPALEGHREGPPMPVLTSIPAPDLSTAHEPYTKLEFVSQPASTHDQTPQLLPTSATIVPPITPQDAVPQP